jgi:hypothetical protein
LLLSLRLILLLEFPSISVIDLNWLTSWDDLSIGETLIDAVIWELGITWELGILVEWNIGAGLGCGVGVFVPRPINGNRIYDGNSGELNDGWLFDISGELNDGWFLDTSMNQMRACWMENRWRCRYTPDCAPAASSPIPRLPNHPSDKRRI